MGRCVYCHSVVTKDEKSCYVCGDMVPQRIQRTAKSRTVSPLTNLVFLSSLAFTAYCFFGAHKFGLPITLAISSTLLLLRILAERLSNRNSN
jgi:hypothetical protein